MLPTPTPPNGNVDSVKDARNNLTVHTYDGFDRLARTYYPLPATPPYGNANDFEELGYDANDNVTSTTALRPRMTIRIMTIGPGISGLTSL